MNLLLRPPNPKTEAIFRIKIRDTQIFLVSPVRNDDVIPIVKSLGYSWDGLWQRSIGRLAGTVEDRATELGCHLLSAGFVIESPTEGVYAKIINQDYEPECKKWVLSGIGEYQGWFRLFWARSGEDFWRTVRNFLPNKYDPSTECVCVPPEHFAEVQDFAGVHGFKISDGAMELISIAKSRRDAVFVVEIDPNKKPTAEQQSGPGPDSEVLIRKYTDTSYREFIMKTTTTIYRYQADAVEKILNLTIGALFMEMGTGKTRVAIEMVHKRQSRISNVVWFCPVSLKETIAYEIKKHTNSPEEQIVKFDEKTTISNCPNVLWYIVGIESMSQSDRIALTVNHVINDGSFVIVDESSYIKGANSIRANRITSMSSRAMYRLIMTGTPLSQGVVDLYSQMRFLSPDILGYKSFYSFARNHLEYSEEYPGMVINSRNTKKLAEKIMPFTHQVSKSECIDLPQKVYDSVYFRMSRQQREAYEQAKYELLLSLDIDDVNSYVIFRLFTALQQIVSGFWRRNGEVIEFEHDRINTLLNTVSMIPDDKKTIIWCKYRHSVKKISQVLESSSLLYGDLSETERNKQVSMFRERNRFLVSTQATGGHGLTLNEAHWVIFYENEFKYSNRLQSEDRCHRIGQDSPVTYIDIGCVDSIDERIAHSLSKKSNVVQDFKRKLRKCNGKIDFGEVL